MKPDAPSEQGNPYRVLARFKTRPALSQNVTFMISLSTPTVRRGPASARAAARVAPHRQLQWSAENDRLLANNTTEKK